MGFHVDEIGGQPYQLPNSHQVGISYILFVLSLWITVISELFAGKVCLPHFWKMPCTIVLTMCMVYHFVYISIGGMYKWLPSPLPTEAAIPIEVVLYSKWGHNSMKLLYGHCKLNVHNCEYDIAYRADIVLVNSVFSHWNCYVYKNPLKSCLLSCMILWYISCTFDLIIC